MESAIARSVSGFPDKCILGGDEMTISINMTRCFFWMLLLSPLLAAQPSGAGAVSVGPGKQSDIVVDVRSPRVGDMIDLLSTNPNGGAAVNFFLPDGRELTDEMAEQNGFMLSGLTEELLVRLDPSVRKALVRGPGDHLIWTLVDKPRGGNYRIRVDNRMATTPVHVEAAFVRIAGIILDSLRGTRGVIIANAVKVPPAAAGVELNLALAQSTEESQIDVASTGDRIAIRLRLPDGTVVTRQNAQANGLEWQQLRYPPDIAGGDAFDTPFVAAFTQATMLPVDGLHYEIRFPAGVRQAGTYTVEADGRQSSTMAEVSAMFVPLVSASHRVDNGIRRLHPEH